MLSKTDENLKHTVSTACRPRVFRIALFKGFPNITPPMGHTVGTNKATMTTTSENPPRWRKTWCPREIITWPYFDLAPPPTPDYWVVPQWAIRTPPLF